MFRTDWAWLQQQSPSTDLLSHMSRETQKHCVQSYHQIQYGMLHQYPNLFPSNQWTLARYSHAFALVQSRSIETNLVTLAPELFQSSGEGSAEGSAEGGAARGPAGKEENDEEKDKQKERVYLSPVLVPILDMFNHRSMSSHAAPVLSMNQNYFELVAMKSYEINVRNFIAYFGRYYFLVLNDL